MTRSVRRMPGVCGGRPCIEGTRLTCADVVLHLRANDHDVKGYLVHYPHLTPADFTECVGYCAGQKCLVDNNVPYCCGCALDLSPPPPPPDAYAGRFETLDAVFEKAKLGQAFLGTGEEYLEDIRPKKIWEFAQEIRNSLDS